MDRQRSDIRDMKDDEVTQDIDLTEDPQIEQTSAAFAAALLIGPLVAGLLAMWLAIGLFGAHLSDTMSIFFLVFGAILTMGLVAKKLIEGRKHSDL